MTRTVTAYQARTNLGELINQVYYRSDEIMVTRNGKPMVKLVRFDYKKKQTKS
jgi:prevent-host-death family protein